MGQKFKTIGDGAIHALRNTYIYILLYVLNRPPWCLSSKDPPAMQQTWVQSLGREDPPEGGQDNPLQYSCLENPMDQGAWQAVVHRVTKSQT